MPETVFACMKADMILYLLSEFEIFQKKYAPSIYLLDPPIISYPGKLFADGCERLQFLCPIELCKPFTKGESDYSTSAYDIWALNLIKTLHYGFESYWRWFSNERCILICSANTLSQLLLRTSCEIPWI